MTKLFHFSVVCNGNLAELVAFTPWAGIVVADNAHDAHRNRRWSGVEIFIRIPGTKYGPPNWDQIYRSVFRYEPELRYPERPQTEYVERKALG